MKKQPALKFTNVNHPVVVLKFKGNRKAKVIHSKYTLMAWFNNKEDQTLVLVKAPLTIGEKLISTLIRNVKAHYELKRCQVEEAFYSPTGIELMQFTPK